MDVLAVSPSEFWNEQIVEQGREAIFLVLVGFVGSFLVIRISTRLQRSERVPWWPGSVSTGDVHVHHLVFGIVLMLAAPTIAFMVGDQSPWWELSALVFGIGAGLTFDEFALWLHLEDVYWAEEGRRSIDAVAIAAAFLMLAYLGAVPFELSGETESFLVSVALALVVVGMSAACFMKRRFVHGYIGLFFPPLALYGALRLAKPGSPWARRRYSDRDPEKERRAEARFTDRRTDRLLDALRDAIGGRPSEALGTVREEAKGMHSSAEAGTRERVKDVRHRLDDLGDKTPPRSRD